MAVAGAAWLAVGRQHRRRAAGAISPRNPGARGRFWRSSLLAAGGGYVWYATRPKPHYVTYVVNAPGLTEYNDNGISSIKPLTIVFSESAAPLKQLQKAVTAGIDAVAGHRRHVVLDERQGTAVHAEGRLAGRRRVHRAAWPARDCSPARSRSRDYRFKFRSQPFAAQHQREPVLSGSARSQSEEARGDGDVQPSGRYRAARTARVARRGQGRGVSGPDARQPPLHGGLRQVQARAPSSTRRALAMPRDDTPMTLRIDKGVRAARGGNDTARPARGGRHDSRAAPACASPTRA